MNKLTFRGGIHPAGNKQYTEKKALVTVAPPQFLYFPLNQHIGAPLQPLVNVGDRVLKMQKIADTEKFMSVPLHASVSGKVKDIGLYFNHSNKKVPTIVIENDGEDEEAEHKMCKNPDDLTPDEMRKIIREAGIVGLGGAAFPTHVKLNPPADKKITHLIVNAAECEPYLTADRRVMIEMPEKVIGGLSFLMRMFSLKECYIGIEDNATDAACALAKKIKSDSGINIMMLRQKYPQGSEKHIITAITGKEVPAGALPMDVGCVVVNVGTVAEIYSAITKGEPLYKRVVTVSGDAIVNPGNFLARVGTPFKALIDVAGGFREEPHKIIMGGPMMGVAVLGTDVPVVKGTSGILAFTSKKACPTNEMNCIRCGRCVSACPMNLMPTTLDMCSRKGDIEALVKNNVMSCIECGSCTYVCPSKRHLVQSIRMGKQRVISQNVKEKAKGGRV